MLVVDSSGLSRLAAPNRQAVALIQALRSANLWPPVVPAMILGALAAHADGVVIERI